MILTEITTDASVEFFDCVPEERHQLLMDYIDMIPSLTHGFPAFIRAACPELFRTSLLMDGFFPFDERELIRSFHQHCLEKHNECKRLLETGFLEDVREFVFQFLESL
jgi:hypothetical protein